MGSDGFLIWKIVITVMTCCILDGYSLGVWDSGRSRPYIGWCYDNYDSINQISKDEWECTRVNLATTCVVMPSRSAVLEASDQLV